MSDKDLLTLAAKAAGIEFEYDDHESPYVWGEWRGIPQKEFWNPLTSDSDALRLAVKLELDVEFWGGFEDTRITLSGNQLAHEDWNNDPYAATRRAIVKAASEIGRGME